jgi:MFS family permease
MGKIASFRLSSILIERDFIRFFCGYALSSLGSAMAPLAIAFALFGLGRGAGPLSWVLAARIVPALLLMLLGGLLADHLSQRRIMIWADVLRLVSQGLLAVSFAVGYGSLPVIVLLAGIGGVGDAFYRPGMNGLIRLLVAPENLQTANALAAISFSAAAILGPVLAGLLVAASDGVWAVALDAITYLISACMLLSISTVPTRRPSRVNVLAQLIEGWTVFRSRSWLWSSVFQFALFNLLVIGPVTVLGPLSFSRALDGASRWGGLAGCLGAGYVFGCESARKWAPSISQITI